MIEKVKVFKALSDENRIRIVECLKTKEKCACTLLEELDIVQSTLSHHMKILVESQIVASRKEGKWTYYSLNIQGCTRIRENIGVLLERSEDYSEADICC